jgi:hypothetical protein
MTFRRGVSGNPDGNRHRTRHLLNQEFMQALLLHFRQHGKKAIEKVAREQPASYLKIAGPRHAVGRVGKTSSHAGLCGTQVADAARHKPPGRDGPAVTVQKKCIMFLVSFNGTEFPMPNQRRNASPPNTVNCTVRKYLTAREIEKLMDYARKHSATDIEIRP